MAHYARLTKSGKAPRHKLTQARVRELLDYRNDGQLVWKVKKARANPGDVAGCIGVSSSRKYWRISIDGVIYGAHQLVFMWHHGFIPKYIDHADGNGLNNRIENLREATQSQNAHNSRMRCDNTSGERNVYWHERARRWFVRLSINRRTRSFGTYKTIDEARAVARRVREEHYGAFARHN
jgi:hypothetical protein